MSGMTWPSKQEKEREREEKERAKNWCGWKLSHYSWQKSRCCRCSCRVSNLAREYHRVTLHSLQTDCPIAPTTPLPPTSLYIIFIYPFEFWESKVSSAVVRRQPQGSKAASRPQGTDTLAANDGDTCTLRSSFSLSLSLPPSPTNCKLAMTFTLQLLLCLKIHVDDEWTCRKAAPRSLCSALLSTRTHSLNSCSLASFLNLFHIYLVH